MKIVMMFFAIQFFNGQYQFIFIIVIRGIRLFIIRGVDISVLQFLFYLLCRCRLMIELVAQLHVGRMVLL